MLRCGELFLKGKNLPFFERTLRENIRILTAQPAPKSLRGRLVMPYFELHTRLRYVFGLVSYSPAMRVPATMEAIQATALSILTGKQGTFKIESKRSDKRFPLTSPELNMLLGKFIEAHAPLQFDGLNPRHILKVEINQDGAYLFDRIIPCHGGLPTGVEGQVALLVDGEASILAGLLFMKRGCALIPISVKQERDISLLQKFSPQKLYLEIVQHGPEMETFATTHKLVIVCGETFDTLFQTVTSPTVFRPLISYSNAEIKQQLARFSTGM